MEDLSNILGIPENRVAVQTMQSIDLACHYKASCKLGAPLKIDGKKVFAEAMEK